jgi:hypothetical protein
MKSQHPRRQAQKRWFVVIGLSRGNSRNFDVDHIKLLKKAKLEEEEMLKKYLREKPTSEPDPTSEDIEGLTIVAEEGGDDAEAPVRTRRAKKSSLVHSGCFV